MIELEKNAIHYCDNSNRRIAIQALLGHGEDGRVWYTSRGTALKAFERSDNFVKELECYRRLLVHQVFEISGLAVPRLLRSMSSCLVIEMTIVQEPYLLDFGKVHLDIEPSYYGEPHIMEERDRKIFSEFGENANKVFALLLRLELYGIYYADPHARNICY